MHLLLATTFIIKHIICDVLQEKGTSQNVDIKNQILSSVVVAVGFAFSLIFHCGTYEPKCPKISKQQTIDMESLTVPNSVDIPQIKPPKKSCKMWLRDIRLYQTGMMFLCTRLSIYVFQSFFPLYLTDALGFSKEKETSQDVDVKNQKAIAYFPLIVLISGAATSSILKYLSKAIGCKLTYIFGALLIMTSSVWLFLVTKSSRDTVYGAAFLTGSGCSIILVTSLAKTADVIGKDKESGAFVYSALSFSYKFLTGIVIFVIQHFKPTSIQGVFCSSCELYYKLVQSSVPGFFAFLGLLAFWLFFPSDFQCRRKREHCDVEIQTEDYFTSIDKNTQYEEKNTQYDTQYEQHNNKNLDNNSDLLENIKQHLIDDKLNFDSKMGVISLDSFDMDGFLSPRLSNVKEISC